MSPRTRIAWQSIYLGFSRSAHVFLPPWLPAALVKVGVACYELHPSSRTHASPPAIRMRLMRADLKPWLRNVLAGKGLP